MILGRDNMHAHMVGHPFSSVCKLSCEGNFYIYFYNFLEYKTYIANMKPHSYDEMLSILFFIQVNILSSLAKEQFDKMLPLFIAKKSLIFIWNTTWGT